MNVCEQTFLSWAGTGANTESRFFVCSPDACLIRAGGRKAYDYSARRKEMLHSAQLEYMREEKKTIHSIHKAAMQIAP
jgi:hypothetical protein